jgi:hypothetical protein
MPTVCQTVSVTAIQLPDRDSSVHETVIVASPPDKVVEEEEEEEE